MAEYEIWVTGESRSFLVRRILAGSAYEAGVEVLRGDEFRNQLALDFGHFTVVNSEADSCEDDYVFIEEKHGFWSCEKL